MEFLVFGEDYNRHPSSTQHLINEIKKDNFVQWINSIGMRQPSFKRKDILRIIEKLTGSKKRYPQEDLDESNLEIIKPLVYPLANNQIIQSINKYLLKSKIKEKKDQRVLWLSLPSAFDYVDILDSDIVVYYCCDDFSSLEGVDHDVVSKREKYLFDRADIIFTTSDTLFKKFESNKTFMLPHGVHDIFFEVEQKEKNKDNIKLGFYGGIDSRIDFKLLESILNKDERVEIEMVGKISDDAKIVKHPRLKILEPKKHSELVKCINGWDILIIPFLPSGYATHCNPLKLREYLASGKQILTTPLPALDDYVDFLKVAKTTNEWLKEINEFGNESKVKEKNRIKEIRKIMSEESWEERAKEALRIIQIKITNKTLIKH